MESPTDQEMTAIKKIVYYTHRSQEREYMSQMGGTHGEAPGSVMRQREQGAVGKSVYCGFCRKEGERQGKQAYFSLV